MSESFAIKILKWYHENKRDLPWRKTRDPYKIWISEIILQQTRVNQGLPYYEKFVNKYPSLQSLADADLVDVLRTWQGLGYYSRARNLHTSSKIIIKDHEGKFPKSYIMLLKLPGIGPYTAAAIASLAFDKKEAVVDGNVFRVISRVFGVNDDISIAAGIKKIRSVAYSLLPQINTGDYNQGIMEFGAVQCVPGIPDCSYCVFNMECEARKLGIQKDLPFKSKKIAISQLQFTYFVFEFNGKYWLKERTKGIWIGLYDFYLVESHISDYAHWLSLKLNTESFTIQKITNKSHILSHRTIEATFIHVRILSSQFPLISGVETGRFFALGNVENLPKPILIEWYLKDILIEKSNI